MSGALIPFIEDSCFDETFSSTGTNKIVSPVLLYYKILPTDDRCDSVWLYDSDVPIWDPNGILTWLASELDLAEKLGQRAWLSEFALLFSEATQSELQSST